MKAPCRRSHPWRVLCIDSSEFSKKGAESVGVARQYRGEKGKPENCQSGVFLGYSDPRGYGFLAGRLYMPHKWFAEEQRARRRETLVPEDLRFQTKPRIARDLIEQVVREGHFPAAWIGCDATLGSDPNFLSSLPAGLRYRRVNSKPVDKATGVRSDQTIVLTGINTAEHYSDKLRRVRFFDVENKKKLVFLTNDFSLPPESIALLYKQRWQVELFFRWIKQHLRIKAFFGTSENAVKTQVWIAISVYVLVAIVKKRLNLDLSLYTILQILSIAVFEKEPMIQILTNSAHQDLFPEPDNQLKLFT